MSQHWASFAYHLQYWCCPVPVWRWPVESLSFLSIYHLMEPSTKNSAIFWKVFALGCPQITHVCTMCSVVQPFVPSDLPHCLRSAMDRGHQFKSTLFHHSMQSSWHSIHGRCNPANFDSALTRHHSPCSSTVSQPRLVPQIDHPWLIIYARPSRPHPVGHKSNHHMARLTNRLRYCQMHLDASSAAARGWVWTVT